MADFTSTTPFEAAKVHELHEQQALPAAPEDRRALRTYLVLAAVAVAAGAGLMALGVEIRDGWESRRDWVVPGIAQFAGIAGVAVAHQLWRRSLVSLSVGATLLLAAVVLTASFIAVDETRANPEPEIDVLRAVTGVVYGITLGVFILSSVWVEWRQPTAGPERETEF